MPLTETQIRRYARHVLLPEVGGVGQARLLAARVVIDLGVDTAAAIAAATYLAASGIGTLVLRNGDRSVTGADTVTGIALGAGDVGVRLADAVAARVKALNPDVTVTVTDTEPGIPIPGVDTTPGLAGALVRGGLAACRTVSGLVSGNRTNA